MPFIVAMPTFSLFMQSAEDLEAKIKAEGLDPETTMYFPGLPEWLVAEKEHKTLKSICKLICLQSSRLGSSPLSNR